VNKTERGSRPGVVLRVALSRYFRLAVSALLLGWIAWKTDWQELGKVFAQLRLELWLAAVALFAVCQTISSVRWRIMARQLGFQQSLGQFINLYFVGTYFNLLLPTSVGGDVVRVWYLNNGSGRRLAALLAVFLDRLSGLLVLLAMACLAVLLSPVHLERWIPWSVLGMTASAVCCVALLPVVARWLPRGHLYVGQIKAALAVLRKPRLFVETTFLSGLVQAGNVVLVWLIGLSLGAQVPGSFYWIMAPMVALLTMLPVSVNGMGVREQSTVLLLAPLGVSQEIALSLALLTFAASAANSLLGGIVYLCSRYPKPGAAGTLPPEDLADGPLDRDPDQGRTRQSRQAA
jgi:glycosyltransferase 2 family protein